MSGQGHVLTWQKESLVGQKILRQIWDILGFCFTQHATIRTCWTAMKWNVGWDFPSEISDLIVGRTGAVGNPWFAKQTMLSCGLWNTNLYYNLKVSRVQGFPCMYQVSYDVSGKPPERRCVTISRVGQLVSKKTHNNIQRFFWKLVSPEDLGVNWIKNIA